VTAPDRRPVFSGKLLLAFVAFAIAAVGLSLYLIGREDYGADTLGPSSYSTSAIGYAGIAEVLQKIGMPVIKSRRNSAVQAEGGVLILAEPQLAQLPQVVLPVLPDAEKILLVLPKWAGIAKGAKKTTWIGEAAPLVSTQVERTLGVAVEQPQIERREKVENWTVNAVGEAPGLSTSVQLIKSDKLRPLVAAGDGILLGEVQKENSLVWVLSDPDVIANHALNPDGKGAAFAIELIQKLRGTRGPVVFDETVHGFQSRPATAMRMLFQFPYSIVTIQILIGIALLLWATTGRFGPPETPPPPLAAGKAGLIDNVADLMEFAGHEQLIIQRYVENTVRETARQLRAPKDLSYQQLLAWLSQLGKKRSLTRDCTEIARLTQDLSRPRGTTDISRFAHIAREINQWKQEMVDGPSAYTRHH
jgi:hypothetical protein